MNALAVLTVGLVLVNGPVMTQETKPSPETWPAFLRESVTETGYQIRFGNQQQAWFFPARKIRVQAEKEQINNGLLPESMEIGTLIGCMLLEHPSVDFRGQSLPSGSYSLHYGLQPVSDDHADTAPSRHFAVYVPVGTPTFESKPNQEKLFKTSGGITGKHPVVMPILPGKQMKNPGIINLGGGIWAFGFSIPAESDAGMTSLAVQLVIAGKSPAAR